MTGETAAVEPLVIVNPASGRGRTRRAFPSVIAALRDFGVDAEVRISGTAADPPAWSEAAAIAGRTVVAFGGDGLVGSVLDAVGRVRQATGRAAPVGIIPGGVGNDFARAVGVPLDFRAAARTLAVGIARSVDLARVRPNSGDACEAKLFGCIASAGFDAVANAVANRITWMSGPPLYVWAALVTLARWNGARFRIEADGEVQELDAWLVAAGNGPSYGGGMRICPGADLEDGLLDVTVLGSLSKTEFLRTFPRVFSGRHVDHPGVHTFRAARITVDADRPFRCAADGEDVAALPVTIEAVPRAVEVIVARPALPPG